MTKNIDNFTPLNKSPSLIKGYLKVGAIVSKNFYIDREFETIHYCVIIFTNRIVKRYQIFFLTTSFAALICFIVITFLEDSKSVVVQGKKSSITAFIRILKNMAKNLNLGVSTSN